ncbi:MAG: hypothetical protein ACTSVY_11770 [Candidatus Helarchaeota archaeon]
MSTRKPSWLRLPCTRCGTEIPELIEGVTLKCLQCGAENTFSESKRFLEKNAKQTFGAVPSIDFIEDANKRTATINERMASVKKLFDSQDKDFEDIQKHAIVATPLEKYGVSGRKILGMVQAYNQVAFLIKNHILPLALTQEEDLPARELYFKASFRAAINLGTFHTIEARRADNNKDATKKYDQASRNFQKAQDFAQQAIDIGFQEFRTKRALAEAAASYSTGLASVTRGNPDYGTRKFKNVRNILEDILAREPRAKIDHVRVGMIVSLQPSVKMILKQLKEGKKVREASKVRLYPLDKSKEIVDTVRDVKEWIIKQSERFEGILKFYYDLNYGEKLEYTDRYRERFNEFFENAKSIFDETVRDIITNLSDEYDFKVGQLYRRLEAAARAAVLPGESTREQFEEGRKELEAIDELYKSVMATLIDATYTIKKTEFAGTADLSIKKAHSQFDDLVRMAITQLILDYDESTQRVFDRLLPIADGAKLPGDETVEYFRDARTEIDSLGFTISNLVDVSYSVKRKEFEERIKSVQQRQKTRFDTVIRRAIQALIGDYYLAGKKIVMTSVPVARAAGALGERAIEEMSEAKRDIDSIDDALENSIQNLIASSYSVRRFEFEDVLINSQMNRDRDFTDSIRQAVQSLLTFTAMPRWKMIRIRKDLIEKGEKSMAQGRYAAAARFFADAAKLSSELGEVDKAKELEERSRGMDRLASMIQ